MFAVLLLVSLSVQKNNNIVFNNNNNNVFQSSAAIVSNYMQYEKNVPEEFRHKTYDINSKTNFLEFS